MPEEQKIVVDKLCAALKEATKGYIFDYTKETVEKYREFFEGLLNECKAKYPGQYKVEVEQDPTDKSIMHVTVTIPREICSKEFLEKYEKV